MTGYTPPTLVVDAVIFRIINGQLCVLLIKRAKEPFKGVWALPGGYNPEGEMTRDAFKRVLRDKAGLAESHLGLIEQLYTFDTVARDPRGHAVSVTYMGLTPDGSPTNVSTTQEPTFFPVDSLPSLAYDHAAIIQYAVERLRAKILSTSAAAALLPQIFTLSQLQAAYEAILGHQIDKRNFRKRIIAFGVLAPTEIFTKKGAHRPARLYTFSRAPGDTLEHNFD